MSRQHAEQDISLSVYGKDLYLQKFWDCLVLLGLLRDMQKRVCCLLRAELWRQIRLLQDYLRVLCYVNDPPWKAEVKLRPLRTSTARMVEIWWTAYLSSVLCQLNKKEDKKRGVSQVLLLGEDVKIPDNVECLLKKGPKFSLEPVVPPHELLAVNRRIANRAPQDQSTRCLLEGVDALSRTVRKKNHRRYREPTDLIVKHFRDNDLRLLQADKEGGFVVLNAASLAEKTRKAISKNFIPVKSSAVRVKTMAANLCKNLQLLKLARDIRSSKGNSLSVFFTAKTHKPEVPFRTIISEKGSWQHLVSQFLLKKLNVLSVNDPFDTKSSDDVMRFLQGGTSIDFNVLCRC